MNFQHCGKCNGLTEHEDSVYAKCLVCKERDALRIQKAKADYLTRLIESERADHDGSHTECLRCAIICEFAAIK